MCEQRAGAAGHGKIPGFTQFLNHKYTELGTYVTVARADFLFLRTAQVGIVDGVCLKANHTNQDQESVDLLGTANSFSIHFMWDCMQEGSSRSRSVCLPESPLIFSFGAFNSGGGGYGGRAHS